MKTEIEHDETEIKVRSVFPVNTSALNESTPRLLEAIEFMETHFPPNHNHIIKQVSTRNPEVERFFYNFLVCFKTNFPKLGYEKISMSFYSTVLSSIQGDSYVDLSDFCLISEGIRLKGKEWMIDFQQLGEENVILVDLMYNDETNDPHLLEFLKCILNIAKKNAISTGVKLITTTKSFVFIARVDDPQMYDYLKSGSDSFLLNQTEWASSNLFFSKCDYDVSAHVKLSKYLDDSEIKDYRNLNMTLKDCWIMSSE